MRRIEHIVILIILLAFLLAISAHAQHTTVTATVLDPIGQPYTNCIGTATFVGQNNTPGAGPYLLGGSTFQTVVALNCNSTAVFTVSLADNNQIRPTPSQWRFTICAPVGLSVGSVPPPICFNATTTITGSSQDLTATLQASAAPLPVNGGGGGGFTLLPRTVATLPSAVSNPGAMFRVTDGTSTSDCTVGGGTFTSVCFSNGTFWQSTGGSGGGGTPGGASTQLQFNNSGVFGGLTAGPTGTPLVSGGSQIPVFASGITYATTAQNWSQFLTTALTGGSPGTVTLTPCPAGADYTSGAGYQVYIADGGSSEAVSVTGGATVGGNCSINFTPFFSHASYTIGSASSGIQETINVACGIFASPTPYFNSQCNVTIPANGSYVQGSGLWLLNNYNVYGTIFFHSNQSVLSGYGVSLNCHGRAHCLQVGDQLAGTHYQNLTVQGIAFQSRDDHSAATGDNNPAYQGCAITQTQIVATKIATITTATACGYRPGDLVTIQFTDDSIYWGDAIVVTASGTTFTFTKNFFPSTKASQTTPGVVNLAYDAILDNAQNTHFADILYDNTNEGGKFSNFFDFWDDENALVEHYNNNAQQLLNNANWTGAHIYSGGNPIGPPANTGQVWASVITLRDSTITANFSSCATVDNSNGLYIDNTICQAAAPWQVKASTTRGNYQGASLRNIYSESNAGLNPLSPAHSPFAGTGIAGLIAGTTSGPGTFEYIGGGGLSGAFVSGGSGATPYTYYIVANDTTASTQTSPMRVLDWVSTGVDTVPVRWPRIANGTDAITYDVIRMTTAGGIGSIYPYIGGCPGGATGTCGYVAFGLTQAAACGASLVCTYNDLTSVDCGSIGGPSTCAYTVKQGNYAGQLNFWPGSLVTEQKTVNTSVEQTSVVGIGLGGNPAQSVNSCSNFGNTSASGAYTTCIGSLTTANNSVKSQTATLMTDGGAAGGGQTLTKGRLNFNTTSVYTLLPHHIITLVDSQPDLTRSTVTYRPPASVNDVWIGTDVAAAGVALNAGKLAFGAPQAISHYIGATGDGVTANWGERLTANLKEFQVLALFDLGFNISGCTSGQVLSHNGTKFVCGTPGVPIDARSTTTEVISNADRLQLVTFNNGSATAVTGPTLASNFTFAGLNIGAGLVTFTPASGLVNGNATQTVPSNWFFQHYVDNGSTYTKMPVMPTIQAFTDCQGGSGNAGNHIVLTLATGLFGCASSSGVVLPSSQYTNATTTLSNIAGLQIALLANTSYEIVCDLIFTGSATTAALQLNATVPSGSSVGASLLETLTDGQPSTFYSHAVRGVGGGLLPTSIVTTATDLPARVTYSVTTGANAGNWQLQGNSSGAGTVTIQTTSTCSWQVK